MSVNGYFYLHNLVNLTIPSFSIPTGVLADTDHSIEENEYSDTTVTTLEPAPPLTPFCMRTIISSNGSNHFAIKMDGTLWGWGHNNTFHQLPIRIMSNIMLHSSISTANNRG